MCRRQMDSGAPSCVMTAAGKAGILDVWGNGVDLGTRVTIGPMSSDALDGDHHDDPTLNGRLIMHPRRLVRPKGNKRRERGDRHHRLRLISLFLLFFLIACRWFRGRPASKPSGTEVCREEAKLSLLGKSDGASCATHWLLMIRGCVKSLKTRLILAFGRLQHSAVVGSGED